MSALLYTLIPSFLAFFLQSGSFALSVSAWISAASGTRPIRWPILQHKRFDAEESSFVRKPRTFPEEMVHSFSS
ncbi:hypothetical protein V6Z11_D11G032000 [Gossypium hirsutum]